LAALLPPDSRGAFRDVVEAGAARSVDGLGDREADLFVGCRSWRHASPADGQVSRVELHETEPRPPTDYTPRRRVFRDDGVCYIARADLALMRRPNPIHGKVWRFSSDSH